MPKRVGDGWDLSGVVSAGSESIRFIYRPMLRHERRLVMRHAGFLGGESGAAYILQECTNRVQAWSVSTEVSVDEMAYLEETNHAMWAEMWMVVSGLRMGNWERESAINLKHGLVALIDAPGFARKTCDECRKHWLDSRGNYIFDGKEKILRPVGAMLPCETQVGCPVGHYSKPQRLSRINCMAYDHYVRCTAISQFPDDEIVKRNAGIIKSVLNRPPAVGVSGSGFRHIATTNAGQRAAGANGDSAARANAGRAGAGRV